jgi:hypothetical protein
LIFFLFCFPNDSFSTFSRILLVFLPGLKSHTTMSSTWANHGQNNSLWIFRFIDSYVFFLSPFPSFFIYICSLPLSLSLSLSHTHRKMKDSQENEVWPMRLVLISTFQQVANYWLLIRDTLYYDDRQAGTWRQQSESRRAITRQTGVVSASYATYAPPEIRHQSSP